MNPIVIGALIGAGGALVGTVSTGVFNYLNSRQQLSYQKSKEWRLFRGAKLEELIKKLEETALHFSGTVTYLASIKAGQKVDHNVFVGKTPFHAELVMLLTIYAPELINGFNKLGPISTSFAEAAN